MRIATSPSDLRRIIISLLALALLVAGCGGDEPAAQEPGTPAEAPTTEPPDDGTEPDDGETEPGDDGDPGDGAAGMDRGSHSVAVGGGPGGGSSYNISAAMGEVVRSNSDNLTPTIEEVSIVQTNMTRLEAGEIQLGFNTTYDAWQAINGDGPFEGNDVSGINFVMGGSIGGFGWVVPEATGISSLEELCGNTAAIGSETAKAILSSLLVPSGVDPECINWDFGITYDQIVVGFQDGTYQIAGFVGIPQTSALLQLVETVEVDFLSPDPAILDQVEEDYPFFPPQTVPAGTVAQQDEDWIVGGFLQGVWTHEDVPEDLVYQWAETVFEHMDACTNIQAGCGDYSAERTAEWINAGLTIVPPHPGIVRYLEDNGFEVDYSG